MSVAARAPSHPLLRKKAARFEDPAIFARQPFNARWPCPGVVGGALHRPHWRTRSNKPSCCVFFCARVRVCVLCVWIRENPTSPSFASGFVLKPPEARRRVTSKACRFFGQVKPKAGRQDGSRNNRRREVADPHAQIYVWPGGGA